MATDDFDIWITGHGMVAGLGYDVRTNAAAVRAGLSGAAELSHFSIRSEVDGDEERVAGSAVPDFTQGFEGFARLLRITQGALSDLSLQAEGKPAPDGRMGFYLSLPSDRRTLSGAALIPDDDGRADAEAAAAEAGPPSPGMALELGGQLLDAAANLARWPVEPELRFASMSGHTGVAQAIKAAVADLRGRAIDVAVIGGIDSLIDTDTLEWLHSRNRLKCSGTPDGLLPGEAGAFIVLETATHARGRNAHALASVRHCVLAEDSASQLAAGVPLGKGVTTAMTNLVGAALDWPTSPPCWVISDHNGETYRAADWAHAVVKLRASNSFFSAPMTWYPAGSLGDTGAASGAVAACLAIEAFERRYAPSPSAAVLSCGDGSERAVVLLSGASN